MKEIREFFHRDQFAKHCGIELVSISPGQAVARMPIHPWHRNGIDTVHGGAIFTLADFAFAAACNSHGKITVAVNVSITFMKAESAGELTAEAREISVNPKLGTYTITVTNEQKQIIALFQGLAYRKEQPLPGLVKNA